MPEYKKPADLLDEMLDKLFERVEEGIRHEITAEKKNTIKSEMAKSLRDESGKDTLGYDELKDKDVQNKLLGCITAKLLGDKNQSESLLKNLLDPKAVLQPDKNLDKKLKEDFLVLGALAKMLGSDKDDKKMSPLDAAKKLLMNKKCGKKDDSKSEDKKPTEKEEQELEKLLDACLRNLNGGTNPRISGAVNFTIIGPIVGNLGAFVDQATPDTNSVAFMVQAITFNSDKTDYQGLENTLKLADLAEGIPLAPIEAPTFKKRV